MESNIKSNYLYEEVIKWLQTIHKYSIGKLYHAQAKPICFDELGIENNLKYFGNERNVMAEILLSRYDLFYRQTNKNALNHQFICFRNRNNLQQPCPLPPPSNVQPDRF